MRIIFEIVSVLSELISALMAVISGWQNMPSSIGEIFKSPPPIAVKDSPSVPSVPPSGKLALPEQIKACPLRCPPAAVEPKKDHQNAATKPKPAVTKHAKRVNPSQTKVVRNKADRKHKKVVVAKKKSNPARLAMNSAKPRNAQAPSGDSSLVKFRSEVAVACVRATFDTRENSAAVAAAKTCYNNVYSLR